MPSGIKPNKYTTVFFLWCKYTVSAIPLWTYENVKPYKINTESRHPNLLNPEKKGSDSIPTTMSPSICVENKNYRQPCYKCIDPQFIIAIYTLTQ